MIRSWATPLREPQGGGPMALDLREGEAPAEPYAKR